MAKSSEYKNFKNSERKEDSYTQGKPHKDIIEFYNRNLAGQKEEAWYIQSAVRGKSAAMNILSTKAIIQNRKDKDFPRKTEVKGIHKH